MVEIPTEYILGFAGLIFIPLFIYLMKNIMIQSNMKAELDFISKRLNMVEEDIKHLFRRRDRDTHTREGEGDSTGGF